MADSDWLTIARSVAARCADGGLDLTHAFNLETYNEGAAEPLSTPFARRQPLALVIGNTARVWASFEDALRRDADLANCEHPLDDYVMRIVEGARRSIATRSAVHWGHTLEPAPIPLQRIAHAAGLAWLGPSHLSVHPTFGPWIALRAVLVFDCAGPTMSTNSPPDPCSSCMKPCLVALEEALAATRTSSGDIDTDLNWRAWLKIRDVCPQGRTYRYSNRQIEYHYLKRRSLLRRVSPLVRP